MPSSLRLLVLGVGLISGLWAQKSPAPSPPRGPSGPSMPITPQQPASNQSDQWPGSQMPIFFSGVVLIEGSGAPASNVAIQRVCDNLPHTVAWTNPRGQFSFRWNYNDVLPEASDAGIGNLAGVPGASNYPSFPGATPGSAMSTNTRGAMNDLPGQNMTGCELTADAPGFRSDRVDLTGHRALDNPDIGTILIHHIGKAEALTVSATALGIPREALKAWQKGVQLFRADPTPDPEGAAREFERAVRVYPRYAEAWLDLGRTRQFEMKEDQAREAYLKAVDADGKMVDALIALGLIASHHREWPDAARYLDRALQLNSVDYPHLWYDDAEADYQVHNLERAERNVRRALKMAPGDREPRAVRLLGLVLLSKQDYVGAESALREYLSSAPDIEDFDELIATLEQLQARLHPAP
jgi:Tfp pilus assembly protein PilF